MKINMKNLLPAVLVVIVFSGIIVAVTPYPMAAKRLPLAVSVIAVILAFILIAQEVLPKKELPDKTAGDIANTTRKKEDLPFKVLLLSAGWILGILLVVGLLGFIIGFSLYVFLYCKLHGGKWVGSIALALGVAAFIYFVFVVGLNFLLPEGLLFQLFST